MSRASLRFPWRTTLMGMIDEISGISVDKKRAWRADAILGIASKSIWRVCSA